MTMTIDEQAQYYADLLALQYRGLPKAQATMQALARQALCNNLAIQVRDAFNIDPDLGDVAVGAQLDIIGKYAGVSRSVLTFTGGVTLTDEDFLTLIYFALTLNSGDGSLKSIETILFSYFGNGITVFDNQNMELSYFFNASIGSLALLEAVVLLDLLPRPTGVGLGSLIYAVGLDNYFAFSSYYRAWPPSGLSGFNSYYTPETLLFTGDTHSNTTIDNIVGIDATVDLVEGEPIKGAGVPNSTYVATIVGPTEITITNPATATAAAANLVAQPQAPWINVDDRIDFS